MHSFLQWVLSFFIDAEVVKIGDSIGIGPDANSARSSEIIVTGVKGLAMVEIYACLTPFVCYTQKIPVANSDRVKDPVGSDSSTVNANRSEMAVLHAEHHDVVLSRTRAHEVVIVLVDGPEYDARILIVSAGKDFNFYTDITIDTGDSIQEAERKPIAKAAF